MEQNYTYDAAANLMLAFRTLCDLEAIAHANHLDSVSMITEENDGKFTFFINGVPTEPNAYRVTDITTEEASIFAQKIEVFKDYWTDIMQKEKESNTAKIAALKAELAKLEGRK